MKLHAIIVLLFVFYSGHCFAQGEGAPQLPSSENATPDVRVVIDISGSMKQNDPQNLRLPALELLVQLFPEGSKAGVWTFGQWVNNLVPSKPVDQAWRDNAAAQALKINSVALRTNIPDALLKAVDDSKNLDPSYRVHVILLTDGMVDVSDSEQENLQARQRIMEEILPSIKDAGITVHTVALSQNADQQLMEFLASETNGIAAVAESAEDLSRIFLQAFDAAAPSEQVPLEGNMFTVDSGIDEFTALIFRSANSDSARFLAPNGALYSLNKHPDNVKWFGQGDYDLVTVSKPSPGDWTIKADLEPDSRVTIVSDMSLRVNKLSKNNFVGDTAEIAAALTEQGQVITSAEFLNLVDMAVQIERRDDGKKWYRSLSEENPIPENGMFLGSLDFFKQAGVYDLNIQVMGKTFQRQKKQTIAVRNRYDLKVSGGQGAPSKHKISLFIRDPAINSQEVSATASVLSPLGEVQSVQAKENGTRRWAIDLQGGEQSGVYQVSFEVEGLLKTGERFSETTRAIDIKHYVEGSEFIELDPPEKVTQEPVIEETPDVVAEEELMSEAPPAKDDMQAENTGDETLAATSIGEEEQENEGMDMQKMALYAGLAVGNILIFVIAYFAYRAVTGGKKDAESKGVSEEQAAEVVEEDSSSDLSGSSPSEDETSDTEGQESEPVVDEPEPEEPEAELEEIVPQECGAQELEPQESEPQELEKPEPESQELTDTTDTTDDVLEVSESNVETEIDAIEELLEEAGIDVAGSDSSDEPAEEDEALESLDLPDEAVDIDPEEDEIALEQSEELDLSDGMDLEDELDLSVSEEGDDENESVLDAEDNIPDDVSEMLERVKDDIELDDDFDLDDEDKDKST